VTSTGFVLVILLDGAMVLVLAYLLAFVSGIPMAADLVLQ
jgi:hypothetical protein